MDETDRLAVADECLLNGRVLSSAVEHPLDMGKVRGSIPLAPTITPDVVVLDLVKSQRVLAANAGAVPEIGFVYVIEAIGIRRFKIGITVELGNRFPKYATECPVECRPVVVATVPAAALRAIEKKIHAHYAAKRVRGEWFDLSQSDITGIVDVIKVTARRPLADLTKELKTLPRTSAERERQWKCQVISAIGPEPAPTEDLVIDALAYTDERGEIGISYKDLARQIRRRPDLFSVVMSLLRRGAAAVVEPVRCNETAVFSIDDLARKTLCRPRPGCDWERSIEGVEMLVWESAESIHRVLSLVGAERTLGGLQGRDVWRATLDQTAFQLRLHGRPDG